MSLARIVGTILPDQHSVSTASAYPEGEHGLNHVCLSIPCIAGQGGVRRIVRTELYPEQQSALERSAQILKGGLTGLQPVATV